MALDNFSELGYNTEFQSGYNPSARHDTTREAFAKYKGIDISKGMPEYMLNEYNTWRDYWNSQDESYLSAYNTAWETWYNSPEEQLKRFRGIGQNAYYTDGIGQQASSSAVPSAHQSNLENEKNGPLSRAMQILGGISDSLGSVGALYSQISGTQANIDYTQQRALGQYLDNYQQMKFLGLDDASLPPHGSLNQTLFKRGLGKNLGRKLGYIGGLNTDSDTFFHQFNEYRNNSLLQGGLNRQFINDNILPLQVEALSLQNDLKQLSLQEQTKYNNEVMPFVLDKMRAEAQMNPKVLFDDLKKEFGDNKLASYGIRFAELLYMINGLRK